MDHKLFKCKFIVTLGITSIKKQKKNFDFYNAPFNRITQLILTFACAFVQVSHMGKEFYPKVSKVIKYSCCAKVCIHEENAFRY